MFNIVMYLFVGVLLVLSWSRDRRKTRAALSKAWKSFDSILPLLLSVVLAIGMMLAVLSPKSISMLIGRHSGVVGIVMSAVIGSITLIPGFVTFPLAASLLKAGAGMLQVTVFISTSMMVGVATMPVEIRYLGKRAATIRNSLALLASFVIAAIMWRTLR